MAGPSPIGIRISRRWGGFAHSSWPGLARPPTTCLEDARKVVGDRAKPGHHGEGKTMSVAQTFF